jgi:hypothetical protein
MRKLNEKGICYKTGGWAESHFELEIGFTHLFIKKVKPLMVFNTEKLDRVWCSFKTCECTTCWTRRAATKVWPVVTTISAVPKTAIIQLVTIRSFIPGDFRRRRRRWMEREM